MIIVIQCAASKRSGAGQLLSKGGKPIVFVADPKAAPSDPDHDFARPDDEADTGMSWREALVKYNEEPEDNPRGLYPAWRLYENEIYERLADRFGVKKVYVLSAGWGLIRSDFLTPYYDITFSQSADAYKRRKKTAAYRDFRMLPDDTDEGIIFFGGKGYLPLFCTLTDAIKGKKIVFYNSASVPQATGCALKSFQTSTRTNWHYECANAFLAGTLRASM